MGQRETPKSKRANKKGKTSTKNVQYMKKCIMYFQKGEYICVVEACFKSSELDALCEITILNLGLFFMQSSSLITDLMMFIHCLLFEKSLYFYCS